MRYVLATIVLVVSSWSEATGAGTASGKHAVPAQNEQADAIHLARQVFAASLAKATTFDEKRAVARRVLEAAGEVQDVTERYVLLRAARNIAAEAGDVEHAVWAIDELDRWFHINRRTMLIESLSEAAKATRLNDHQKLQIAGKLLDAVQEAIDYGDIRAAASLLAKALRVSRTLRDAAALKQIVARARTHRAVLTKYKRLPDALRTLRANPKDPDANLLVGKYHALIRGDWQRAIALLERCSSPEFRAIAAQEQLQPADAHGQVRVGDGWWSLAQQEDDREGAELLRRASHWYRLALPNLPPGLTRMKITDRLQEPAVPNPVVEAARKLVENIVELGGKAAEEQRIAADRAHREAKKANERALRQQIAEFRRRDRERIAAARQEMAIRELDARARIAESQVKAAKHAWKRYSRRAFGYPVRADYYAHPRANYFYGLPYTFYSVPLLGFYDSNYRLNYRLGHYKFAVSHDRGHHHRHH